MFESQRIYFLSLKQTKCVSNWYIGKEVENLQVANIYSKAASIQTVRPFFMSHKFALTQQFLILIFHLYSHRVVRLLFSKLNVNTFIAKHEQFLRNHDVHVATLKYTSGARIIKSKYDQTPKQNLYAKTELQHILLSNFKVIHYTWYTSQLKTKNWIFWSLWFFFAVMQNAK